MSSNESGPVLRLAGGLERIQLAYDKAILELSAQLLNLTKNP